MTYIQKHYYLLSWSPRKHINPVVEVEQSSYEDDLQILRVIEAYCTSKQRQTITNSGIVIQVIINSKTNNP